MRTKKADAGETGWETNTSVSSLPKSARRDWIGSRTLSLPFPTFMLMSIHANGGESPPFYGGQRMAVVTTPRKQRRQPHCLQKDQSSGTNPESQMIIYVSGILQRKAVRGRKTISYNLPSFEDDIAHTAKKWMNLKQKKYPAAKGM